MVSAGWTAGGKAARTLRPPMLDLQESRPGKATEVLHQQLFALTSHLACSYPPVQICDGMKNAVRHIWKRAQTRRETYGEACDKYCNLFLLRRNRTFVRTHYLCCNIVNAGHGGDERIRGTYILDILAASSLQSEVQ
jgi:hypothetical protein